MTAPALLGPAAGPVRLAAGAGFVAVLTLLSVIDLRTRRLPDPVVLPALWAGLLLNAGCSLFAAPPDAVLGAAAGYGALWLLSAAYGPRSRAGAAFGGGDLKLAAMIGAWLGVEAMPAALLVAFTSGTLAVLPGLVRGRLRLGQAVPFGPALALGGAAALAAGPSLAGWLAPWPAMGAR